MKILKKEIEQEKTYKLLICGTIIIQREIDHYRKLLNSDRYFTEEEYQYFGSKIYFLRFHRKKIAEELALRFWRFMRF